MNSCDQRSRRKFNYSFTNFFRDFCRFTLFCKSKGRTLEEQLDDIFLERKELEEAISLSSFKIEKLEKNLNVLLQEEKSISDTEIKIKIGGTHEENQQRRKEHERWNRSRKLHHVETARFEVLRILMQSNDELRTQRNDLLCLGEKIFSLEQEIENETHLKQLKKIKEPKVGTAISSVVPSPILFGEIILPKKLGISFRDLFALSIRTFRTKFAMTMMTILGIGVSFATIFFLVSLGYGLEKILLDQFASPTLLRSIDVSSASPEALPLNTDAMSKINALPGVELIEPIFGLSGQMEFDSLASEVEYRGASPKYFELLGKKMKEGEIYKEGDRSVIISSLFLQTAGKTFDNFPNPVTITVYHPDIINGRDTTEIVKLGSDFRVVGVVDDPNNSFVYLSPKFISGMVNQYSSMKVLAKDVNDIPSIRNSISDMGFITSSVLDTVDQATKVFGVLEILLALFGAASLLVATIGMVNTMTVSLLQRTQEIGVMKVLGVADNDVKKLFLLEAAIIGGLGGLSGIIMGFVFSQVFNFGINFLAKNLGGKTVSLFYYPLWFIIGVVVASFIIGIFTGIIPAQRAAKMDPINAVKYK